MIARFPDRCDYCGGHISIGDLIDWELIDGHRWIAHAECRDIPEPVYRVCPNCFLAKPCPCDDDQ